MLIRLVQSSFFSHRPISSTSTYYSYSLLHFRYYLGTWQVGRLLKVGGLLYHFKQASHHQVHTYIHVLSSAATKERETQEKEQRERERERVRTNFGVLFITSQPFCVHIYEGYSQQAKKERKTTNKQERSKEKVFFGCCLVAGLGI